MQKRQVYRDAKRLTAEWLKGHKQRIFEYLFRNYKMETTKVYTTDDESFQRHRAHETQMLRRNRHFYRWKAYNNDPSPEKLEDWNKLSAEARRNEEQRIQKEELKLGDDEYGTELDVAARVRGYYLTAAMRFIDVTAMQFTSGLFPELISDIEMHLDREMGLAGGPAPYDPDMFVRLMEEEPSTAAKRSKLKGDVLRFNQAVEGIQELNQTVMRASASAPPRQVLVQDLEMEDADGEEFYDGD